ncbi:hypothetical protein RJ035_003818 [Blastomyces gilchristii]
MTYASSHPLNSTSFAAEIASSGRSDVEGESTSRHSVPLDSIGRVESTVTLSHGNSVDPSLSVVTITEGPENSSAVEEKTSIQDSVSASPSQPGSELQIQAPTCPSTSKGLEPTMLLETITASTTNSTDQFLSVTSPSSIVITSLLSDSTSGDSRPAFNVSSHHQQATLSETEASVSSSGSVSGVHSQLMMEIISGFPTFTSVDISKLRNNDSLSSAAVSRLTDVIDEVVVGATEEMAVIFIVLQKIQKRK